MANPNIIAATSLVGKGLLNTPALLPSSETIVYQVPASKSVKISNAALCNTSSADVVVSVSVTPSGVAGSTVNRVIASYTLKAHDTIDQEGGLAVLKGAMLGENQTISILCGTASAVTMAVMGTEIT